MSSSYSSLWTRRSGTQEIADAVTKAAAAAAVHKTRLSDQQYRQSATQKHVWHCRDPLWCREYDAVETSVGEWVCRVWRSTRHIIGHFGDDFYRPDDQTNSVKALKENGLVVKDQAWIPPEPLHHVTIIQLYAQCKGPNVTNPICLTCKNCSHKCCGLWTLCHTIQPRAVLIIFPLKS